MNTARTGKVMVESPGRVFVENRRGAPRLSAQLHLLLSEHRAIDGERGNGAIDEFVDQLGGWKKAAELGVVKDGSIGAFGGAWIPVVPDTARSDGEHSAIQIAPQVAEHLQSSTIVDGIGYDRNLDWSGLSQSSPKPAPGEWFLFADKDNAPTFGQISELARKGGSIEKPGIQDIAAEGAAKPLPEEFEAQIKAALKSTT